MSAFEDFNNSIWSSYISQNTSEAIDDPFLSNIVSTGLNYLGLYGGQWLYDKYLTNKLNKLILKNRLARSRLAIIEKMANDNQFGIELTTPEVNNSALDVLNLRIDTPLPNFSLLLPSSVSLPNPTLTTPTATLPVFNSSPISTPSPSTLTAPAPVNATLVNGPVIPEKIDYKVDTSSVDTSSKGLHINWKELGNNAGGAAIGMVAGLAVGALGSKVFGDSQAGLMATGVTSLLASSVAGTAGQLLLSGLALNLSSLGSTSSLASGGMGLANLAIDVFDPVKKSKTENALNMAAGAAALIPGVGPFAAAGMLAMNAIGHLTGSKVDDFTVDKEVLALTNGSYGGSVNEILKEEAEAGIKYSGFNAGGRHKAEARVAEAKRKYDKIKQTIGYHSDKREALAANSNFLALANELSGNGGYDQSSVRVGRTGLKISPLRAQRITSRDPFTYYLSTLPENLKDSSNFRVKDYWVFNGKPKDFYEAIHKGMFTKEKDGWHASSVAENPETGEIEFMKASSHPSHQMEVNWYNSDDPEAVEFRKNYELIKSEPYWKYVKRPPKVEEFKLGGSIIELIKEPTYIELIDFEEELLEEFKLGGSINVIPEGALHARKHNMDTDLKITKKGIPVVDNQGTQLAEIEKSELILRLEVTKKLEELQKLYYNEESSNKEKEEWALEAGKLLVDEILNNTIDNTNTLL